MPVLKVRVTAWSPSLRWLRIDFVAVIDSEKIFIQHRLHTYAAGVFVFYYIVLYCPILPWLENGFECLFMPGAIHRFLRVHRLLTYVSVFAIFYL